MRVLIIALLAAISYAQTVTDEEMKELESLINGLESQEFLEELEKVVGMEGNKEGSSSSNPGDASSSKQGDPSSSKQGDPSSSKQGDLLSSSDDKNPRNAPSPGSPDQSTPEERGHARAACEMALNNYLSRVCQVGLIRHEGGTNEKVKMLCEHMARKPSISICELKIAKESGIDADACKAMASKIKTKVFDLKAMCAQKVQKDFPQDVFIGFDGSPVFVRRDSLGARTPAFAKDTEQAGPSEHAGSSSSSVWSKMFNDKDAKLDVIIGPDMSPTILRRGNSDGLPPPANSASSPATGSRLPERSPTGTLISKDNPKVSRTATGTLDTGVFDPPPHDKEKKSPKASTKIDAEVGGASFVHVHSFLVLGLFTILIFFSGIFFGIFLEKRNRDASYSLLSEV